MGFHRAFPALAGMLLGPRVKIKAPLLLEAFIEYLSEVDRGVLKEAIALSRAGTCSTFSATLKESLLSVLSVYSCRQVPTPDNLHSTLMQVAKYVFRSKPMLSVTEIHSGIPQEHKDFWCSKTVDDVYALYQCMSVTPSKLLQLLEEPIFQNKAEASVYTYLRQFIGNMSLQQSRAFLRFVTGSSACTAGNLEVQFNSLSGLSRRPIAHTCSNCLELPSTYTSYPELEKEFHVILSDEEFSWVMDAL